MRPLADRRHPLAADRLAGYGHDTSHHLRPDLEVRREVDDDVVRRKFGIAGGVVQIEVHDRVVVPRGEVERRSQVAALIRHVPGVDGMVEVDARSLGWRVGNQVTTTTTRPGE